MFLISWLPGFLVPMAVHLWDVALEQDQDRRISNKEISPPKLESIIFKLGFFLPKCVFKVLQFDFSFSI